MCGIILNLKQIGMSSCPRKLLNAALSLQSLDQIFHIVISFHRIRILPNFLDDFVALFHRFDCLAVRLVNFDFKRNSSFAENLFCENIVKSRNCKPDLAAKLRDSLFVRVVQSDCKIRHIYTSCPVIFKCNSSVIQVRFTELLQSAQSVLQNGTRAGKIYPYKIFASLSVFRAFVYEKPCFILKFFGELDSAHSCI